GVERDGDWIVGDAGDLSRQRRTRRRRYTTSGGGAHRSIGRLWRRLGGAERAMIAARHLSRTFGDRSAVEDVTFDVRAGEIFGLLGPNGAGKTTTLRMLAGLIAPTSGEASVAGVPLTSRTIDRVRQHVGFLTETPGLWERLSVRTNLLTYARLHQVKDPAATVSRALERFGLSDRAESMAVELSKGLKQRVALARTLLPHPPVALLDEP